MKKINTDVLIVGAGPVGLFSVFELGQLGIKSCIVDCLNEIGGQCSALYPEKPIYDIPAYPVINAQELILNLNKQIKPFNPEVLLSQQVEKIIDLDNSFKVFTSNNIEISTKCIFIAAGNGAFGPNKPPIENIEKFEDKSVFYSVKNKSIFDNKTVAIAGGGDSAVDWAIELSKNAKKIFFIHRREKLRAEKILQKRLFDNNKIEIIWNSKVNKILGENNPQKVTGVELENLIDSKIVKLSIDGVFVAIGHSPNTKLFKDKVIMDEENYIITKEDSTKTNINGVFACGDVQDKIYRQAVTAAGTGCMAALEVDKYLSEQEYN